MTTPSQKARPMTKLNPNRNPAAFNHFADAVNNAARKAVVDIIEGYRGDLNEAEQGYAAVAGLITAAGFLTKGMVEVFGLNPNPLLNVVQEQFLEGMKGPSQERGPQQKG